MKITDLVIDSKTLGEKLWLVGVMPAYAYKNGEQILIDLRHQLLILE